METGMTRRISAAFAAFVVFLLLSLGASAQEYVAGEHYDVISPAIRGESEKIEVTEFFWYGCGHCYNFEPQLAQWKKSLAEDVAVVGSPAMWNGLMEVHAKAFYAAETLGVLDQVHMPLFQALNVDRKRLASEDEIAELFEANGVPAEKFREVYNSFGVGSQVRQANSRARAARISGTPEMMVAGKYRISTRKAGSQANMLKIAEYLIEKERSERAASTAAS
jgi:thiol:disulfide interchange protein DsbA